MIEHNLTIGTLLCYINNKSDIVINMTTDSMVISMRLSGRSGRRLKRMANQHGWTPSDTSARLVEEGFGGWNSPS